MRLMRRIGRMGPMGPMGLIGLMGLMGLMGCSGDSAELPEPTPEPTPVIGTAITFSGQQSEEQGVTRGGDEAYRANEANGTYGTYGAYGSRAGTPLSDAGVTSFRVWGYKNNSYDSGTGTYGETQEVFPGYNVNWAANSAGTTTTNSDGWEYVNQQASGDEQTIKYWDWGAKAYRFFGVAGTYVPNGAYGTNGPYEFTMTANCSDDDGDETPNEEEVIAANIAAAPYFTRLWFSTGALPTYADRQFGRAVQLEFVKPFARVRFLFNYSYVSEGIKMRKEEFKPTNGDKIALKGTVTVSYPLTGTATQESYTATPKENPAEGETLDAFTEEYIPEGTEKWYTVLPRHSQGPYTMGVWMNNDNLSDPATRTAVVPAEFMTWLPGYSYTYIFKILEEGGVEIELVQAAVTPWTDMVGERDVYNW